MSRPDTPWITSAMSGCGSLFGRERCDVCVVGAGIAGLTAAYHLAMAGRDVLVVDAAGIGAGETRRTSAHLASALDDRFRILERLHGSRGARLAAESHATAIDFIERLASEQHIACSFRRIDGYLISADGSGRLLAEEAAAALRAGLDVEEVGFVPGLAKWSGPGLRFRRQARFEPLAYLHGLHAACCALGVRVVTGIRVERVEDDDSGVVIQADNLRITCSAGVIATDVPINDRVILQTKLEAYRSYVIALRAPANVMPDILLWDDGDPYHYLRLSRDAQGTLLLVGGEDHKTGQGPTDGEEPHQRLEAWARQRFPGMGPVEHAWSGQIIEPVDGLASIGLNPGGRHVYVITGDSGNGLTHGTLGGMLVADGICGRPNAWAELYRPSRVTLGAAVEYAGHNANVLRQYADWLQVGDVASPEDIPAGQGAIQRQGIDLLAVHRDHGGRIQACSAVCPHLGGVVRWNSQEGTWDCPCHGSRFGPDGAVLNGPANTPLKPVQTPLGPPAAAIAPASWTTGCI